EDGIRDRNVTGVQTCALPILSQPHGCEAQLRGRTAIPSEFAAQGSAREVTDLAPDEVAATGGRAAALVAVLGVAIGLAMVPVLRSEERRVGKERMAPWWACAG